MIKKVKCKYCNHVIAEAPENAKAGLIIKCNNCKRKMLVTLDKNGNLKTEEYHELPIVKPSIQQANV